MILGAIASAWADPAALRGPDRAPTAVIGLHDLSVGAPFGPLDLAAEVRVDGGATGASVGIRRTLRSGAKGWRVDVGGSAGVLVPLVAPGVGLSVTGWTSAGLVGRRGYIQGLFAVPAAASLDQGVRVPLLPELQGGVIIGPVLIGPRIAFGAVWAGDVSVATEAALSITVR